MPGRNGYSVQGGWAEGGSNASGVPGSLTLDGRVDNQPPEYVASENITFLPGFESGTGDEFSAYIIDGNGGSGSRSSGGEYAGGGYRYGFNGKENDNEIKGEGAQQDYGMRIYDPRLGRFLSVDPLTKGYPMLTPYQFASNSPIANVDLDGQESKYYTRTITYIYEHRVDAQLHLITTIRSESKLESKESGWLGGLLHLNGPLGSGTAYTIQTQVVDEFYGSNGGILPIKTVVYEPEVKKSFYRLSIEDEQQMNKTVDRPQYTGNYQVMVLGSGNGMYPDDNSGSKANPNAKTLTINMNDWNEVFEPILLGMDPKTPTEIELPKLSDMLNERFEARVDELAKEREKSSILLPSGSDSCLVDGTIAPAGTLNNHDPYFITPTKVPHLIPDPTKQKKDSSTRSSASSSVNSGSGN